MNERSSAGKNAVSCLKGDYDHAVCRFETAVRTECQIQKSQTDGIQQQKQVDKKVIVRPVKK